MVGSRSAAIAALAFFCLLNQGCTKQSFQAITERAEAYKGVFGNGPVSTSDSETGDDLVNEGNSTDKDNEAVAGQLTTRTDSTTTSGTNSNTSGTNSGKESDSTVIEGITYYNTNETAGSETVPGASYTGGLVTVPTSNFCSFHLSNERQTNAAVAATLQIRILDANGNTKCTANNHSSIKNDLTAKNLKVSNCSLADGSYRIHLIDSTKAVSVNVYGAPFDIVGGQIIKSMPVTILADGNPSISETGTMFEYQGTQCDFSASPLFVDMREDANDYDYLTAPWEGVQFDILGANGKPAYTKRQISWFKNARFSLLALPDATGQVRSIDQLFGDNTLGPDGKFSANGFVALAKYDDNKDGLIDNRDAVYSKLVLWADYDRDGVSKYWELTPISMAGVTSIELDYDENFREVDQYGNEIKFRSVVNFLVDRAIATKRQIFDVWFTLY